MVNIMDKGYKVQDTRNGEHVVRYIRYMRGHAGRTATENFDTKMKKIQLDFYRRENVLQIAEELLGKLLVTNKDGIITSGRIVECEAYAGVPDKASHAVWGKKNKPK